MLAKPLKRLFVALASVLCTVVTIELGFRFIEPRTEIDLQQLAKYREFVRTQGLTDSFEPRPHTVFGRPRQPPWNQDGFACGKWSVMKPDGVLRIACLGESTTEGGNGAGRRGAFPWILEQLLEQQTERSFEVMNCGVSGWTTAEILVSWFLTLQDYRPDLVILHVGVNDVLPRTRAGFRVDYTHWRHHWDPPRYNPLQRTLVQWSDVYAVLSLQDAPDLMELTSYPDRGRSPVRSDGSLPDASARAFRRNVETIGDHAGARGARVLLMTMPMDPEARGVETYRFGISQHNEILRELALDRGWLLADAAKNPRFTASSAHMLYLDMVHLKPAGNQLKAALLFKVLMRDWLPKLGHD